MTEMSAPRSAMPPISPAVDAGWVEVVAEESRILDDPTNPEIVLAWVGQRKITARNYTVVWMVMAVFSAGIVWLLFK